MQLHHAKYLHRSFTIRGEPVPQEDFLQAQTTLRQAQSERKIQTNFRLGIYKPNTADESAPTKY